MDELARVLRDPETGRYAVTAKVDCTSQVARREIEGFFATARVTDSTSLLYLSCHGVQDKNGRLYFAFTDTERDLLGSTGVSAEWVRDCIHSSRSKATVVLVDCCFSGGFIKGMRSRSTGANVETLAQDIPPGTGLAVLTASGDTEASYEDAESQGVRPSYFTAALISGIASGAADRNRDGRITADELYDHIYEEIRRGPSPQRPRRLGTGEGALVVADATPAPGPSSRGAVVAPALVAKGVLGWVSFDGQWIVIGKNGVGHTYKGERRYHVRQLSGVAMRPATRWNHGYIQVILPGVAPAPIARFGAHAGRPPLTDDDSISFAYSANEAVTRIRDAVQDAINGAHSTGRPARRDPGESPVTFPRGAARGRVTLPDALTDASPRSAAEPGPSREAERLRGTSDGARVAATLPFAALDGLVACQFDVVRWLMPWRRHWQHAVDQPSTAPSVPPWLVELAQFVGGHAAPSGTTNSTFSPGPAYLAGFCTGVRTVWSDAAANGLVPADRTTMTWWMAQPADWLRPGSFMAEATIRDITRARRRTRRVKVVRGAGRVALWAVTLALLLMEIAAIAISIEGSWLDGTGKPAADQTPHILGTNLLFGIPLIGLCTLVVLDLKRSRRNASAPVQARTTTPSSSL